ncbi:MAG: type II toxin-antitoxin system VapB family antitoxin [Mycobacteriales bacterium]
MSRTNIELDDVLVDEIMRRYQLKTKREAVNYALRRVVGTPLTKEFLLSLQGIGWEGDLEQMRRSKVVDWGEETPGVQSHREAA